MKSNEKETIKNMEKTNNMNEKIHYEIKFLETEDGYRLEATGDKHVLNQLGISPNMLGRNRKHGYGRPKGRRGLGKRGPGHTFRRRCIHQRREAMARRHAMMNNQPQFNDFV